MDQPVTIWIATMKSEFTRSAAYGWSPEEALTLLIRTWIEKHCREEVTKAYPWHNMDSIDIDRVVVGQGYTEYNGNDDPNWYPEFVDPKSPRLAGIWDALAREYEVDLSPLLTSEELLDEAFGKVEANGMDEAAIHRLRNLFADVARNAGIRNFQRTAAVALTGEQAYLTRLK